LTYADRQGSNGGLPERPLQDIAASTYWLFCRSKSGRLDNNDFGSAIRVRAKPFFAYAHVHLIKLRYKGANIEARKF
jgi:hypothetical protein